MTENQMGKLMAELGQANLTLKFSEITDQKNMRKFELAFWPGYN
jgi:hypothetical protein